MNGLDQYFQKTKQEIDEKIQPMIGTEIERQLAGYRLYYDFRMPKRVAHRVKKLKWFKKYKLITQSQLRHRIETITATVLNNFFNIKLGKASIDPSDPTRLDVELMVSPALHECLVTFKVPK